MSGDNVHRFLKFLFLLVMAAGILSVFGACASVRHANPARIGDGESPSSLPRGVASFHMGVGENYRDSEDGSSRERIIKLGSVVGLSRSFDLRASVSGSQPSRSSSDDFEAPFMSMATRIKWNPELLKRFFAVSAGVGFGVSDISGVSEAWLYSIECAQIVGFENRYLVPYVNVKGQINKVDNNGSERLPETWGYEFIAGAKLPFLYSRPNPPFVKVEASRTRLYGGGGRFNSFLYDVQLEVPFKY